MNTGGHRSFNDCTVPSSMNVFLAQNMPPQSQRFQSYQQGLNYSAKDFDRSISPKNNSGNESAQFTQGWLPNSQPNWKIDNSSFSQPMHPHQPYHTDLFANNPACQPSQIVHCDSGYETWDEPPKPLLSQDGFSRRQSSESLVKAMSPQSFSTTATGIPRAESER
jgi:hypothetical protein